MAPQNQLMTICRRQEEQGQQGEENVAILVHHSKAFQIAKVRGVMKAYVATGDKCRRQQFIKYYQCYIFEKKIRWRDPTTVRISETVCSSQKGLSHVTVFSNFAGNNETVIEHTYML